MTAAKITTAAKIVSTACKVVSNAATFTQAAISDSQEYDKWQVILRRYS